MRSSLLLLLTLVVAGNATLAAQEPASDVALRSVLAVLSDTSSLAATMRVDPRVLSHSEAFLPEDLAPLSAGTLGAHRRIIREAGYREGDFFLAVECDPSGRTTITNGADTLMRPALPPASPEMRQRCLAVGDEPVLIVTRPEPVDGLWRLRASIVGASAGEFWQVTIGADGTVREVERLLGWRT